MSRKASGIGIVVIVAAGVLVAFAAWRVRSSATSGTCQACNRPLHELSRTVGLLDGKREIFCCPACALTTHRQTGKTVRIVELTDYQSDRPLDPNGAFIVEGSELNLCSRQHALVHSDKQPVPVDFDRCSPSMIAFAHREAAQQFVDRYGGTLMRFRDLAALYR